MPLAADRNTPRAASSDNKSLLIAASMLIYAGALVARSATGYATKGAAATTLVGVGRAAERVDNSSGSAGDKRIKVEPGIFRFANSSSTDEITIAEIGKPCFIVDDQTVAKTNGSSTRSVAGFVHDVDSIGVWVEFDEAKVRAYLG